MDELTPWNPWKEIERAQAEAEAVFDAVFEKLRRVLGGRPISFVPVTDIIEVADEYRLYLSLPGMVEEDIDIALDGDILVIRGEREPPFDLPSVTVHQRQWKYGYFERRVQLPEPVDGDAIRATYDGGVLAIRVPKTVSGPEEPPQAGGEAEGKGEKA
jgi:HSP20 family protein